MSDTSAVPETTAVEDSIAWLLERLPPKCLRPDDDLYTSECAMNGVDAVIGRLIGLDKAPLGFAHWYHGWPASKHYFDKRFPRRPETYAYWMKKNPGSTHWPVLVGGEAEFHFMRDLGVESVHLTGLPFIYEPVRDVERKDGSLLICPTHEWFKDDTKRQRMESGYIAEILKLKDRFSQMAVCVHSACFQTGRWVRSFRDAGIPVISGGNASDLNCFNRMRTIFSSFEFMTTHVVSSHVAFAGFCGSKISFYGPQPPTALEDFGVYFSDVNEARLFFDVTSEFNQRDNLQAKFPFLFKEPHEAVPCQDWASFELGLQYKKDPLEIARLLGWKYDPVKYPEMKVRGGFDYWFPKLGVAPEAREIEKRLDVQAARVAELEKEMAARTTRLAQVDEELNSALAVKSRLDAEIVSLRKECKKQRKDAKALAKKNDKLEKTVRSAVEWQKKSMFKRAFHRWRPKK